MKFIKHDLPSGDPWCWEGIGSNGDTFWILPVLDGTARIGCKIMFARTAGSHPIDGTFTDFREAKNWLKANYDPKKAEVVPGAK